MARSRSIKPEFWTDEILGEVSPSARLLFIATWTFADDAGNLERSARQLKAQAFPYDHIDCEPLISELLRVGVLIEYAHLDRKFLHIKGFVKHQRIENASKPRFPAFDDPVTTTVVLTEPSPSPLASSLGVESSRRESITKKARAAPIDAADVPFHDSLPTEAWAEWLEHRKRKRWPCDAVTLRKQLALLAPHDRETQRGMLDQSIQAGWQGLFPLKPAAALGRKTKFTQAMEALDRG